jgi:hypothetical protein
LTQRYQPLCLILFQFLFWFLYANLWLLGFIECYLSSTVSFVQEVLLRTSCTDKIFTSWSYTDG